MIKTLIFFQLIIILAIQINPQSIYNLSNYDYPHPIQDQSSQFEKIVILGTNDIHGHLLPRNLTYLHTDTQQQEIIKVGGATLLSSYIDAYKEEWKENLLYLDGGDLWTGTLESQLFNGASITEFYNLKGLNATALGNHDFDMNLTNLNARLNQSIYTTIDSNLYNKTTDEVAQLYNTNKSKVYQVGSLKVGVIGLITNTTPFTTAFPVDNYFRFENYLNVTIMESNYLRQELNADIVVLTCHIGMFCNNPKSNSSKNAKKFLDVGVRTQDTDQDTDCSPTDELYKFLMMVPENVLDGVVGGHVHTIVHHWVNNIPVIIADSYSKNLNALYLTYDKLNRKIIKENIEMEGPIPICSKIFEEEKICNIPVGQTAQSKPIEFTFHNKYIQEDLKLIQSLQNYIEGAQKIGAEQLGFIQQSMPIIYNEEFALGNWISDVVQNVSKSDISFINVGMLRSEWDYGFINYYDLFETLPFENKIQSVDMTGKEVKLVFKILQEGTMPFYPTTGLYQEVTGIPTKQLLYIRLYNGTEIDDNKTYRVGGIDFIFNGGDDFHTVLQYYKPRNIKLFMSIRDGVKEALIKQIYINDPSNPAVDPNKPRLKIIQKNLRGQIKNF